MLNYKLKKCYLLLDTWKNISTQLDSMIKSGKCMQQLADNKMRCLIALCLCFFVSSLFAQSQTFTLSGTFLKNAPERLIIGYNNNSQVLSDTIYVNENKFTYTGRLNHPVIFFVKAITNNKESSHTQFFINSGKFGLVITNGSDINSFKLTGSKTQNDQDTLSARKAPLYLILTQLRDQISVSQTKIKNGQLTELQKKQLHSDLDSLSNLTTEIKRKIRLADTRFFDDYPKSLVTLFTLNKYLKDIPRDSLRMYFDKMDYNIKNSAFAEQIKLRLTQPDVIIGSRAYMFSATDIDNKTITLSEIAEKNFVLLDFWASWCVPCRAGNPALKETYKKYKHLGFEIIGISDDLGKDKFWRQAVNQDGIGIWKHILRGTAKDLKKERILNDLNQKYSVNSLPTKILINKEGYIVDIFKAGDERLDLVLNKLFSKR